MFLESLFGAVVQENVAKLLFSYCTCVMDEFEYYAYYSDRIM